MNTIEALRTCQLCRGLSDDELGAIAGIVSLKSYPKSSVLFLEGDPAEGMFSLVEGKVRIYKASEEGKEFTIHIINPGQLFAEAAIFGDQKYPANCIALKEKLSSIPSSAADKRRLQHSTVNEIMSDTRSTRNTSTR